MPGSALIEGRLVSVVAWHSRAEKRVSRAVIVPAHDFREGRIYNSQSRTYILIVGPGITSVVRNSDMRATIRSLVTEINRVTGLTGRLTDVVVADAHRRVDQETARAAGRHRLDCPGKAVVVRDHDGSLAVAAAIRDVDRSIPGHLDVPMNAGALSGVV